MAARRFSLRAGLAAVALVAVVLSLFTRTSGVTQGDYGRLRPGMTRAETERLLHGPPRNDVRRNAIIWVPKRDGRQISAEIGPAGPAADFFPGVAMAGGERAVWSTETGLIAVDYGRDGRLRSKYYSNVHIVESPNLIDWLASRPGMIRRSFGP